MALNKQPNMATEPIILIPDDMPYEKLLKSIIPKSPSMIPKIPIPVRVEPATVKNFMAFI